MELTNSLAGGGSIEATLSKLSSVLPTGYTIEAAYERPETPAIDSDLAAATAAAAQWRNSLKKGDV